MSMIESIYQDGQDVSMPALRAYEAALEVVSVQHDQHGGAAVGDGIADDYAAIQGKHDYIQSESGGALFFPCGTYAVSDQLDFTGPALGIKWYAQGNAGGSAYGTIIRYTGGADVTKAVIKATGASFLNNRLQDIAIDANGLAGMCVHLDAWHATQTTPQKRWKFEGCGFLNATRSLVVIGDATYTTDYATTTKDIDANMNQFIDCTFTPMEDTLYGLVINVENNEYQTKLENVSFEGTSTGISPTLAEIVNYVRVKAGNALALDNVFFPPIPHDYSDDTATKKYACVRYNCALMWNGGVSVCEEARVLYRDAVPSDLNNTVLIGVQVNDPSDNDDATPKICINNFSGAPMTLIGCHFAKTGDGTFSREVRSSTAVIKFTAIDCDFGATPVFTKVTPFMEWVTPTFNSADYTQTGGTSWTVDSGDVVSVRYTVTGKTMKVDFYIGASDVAGTPSSLNIAIPLGLTSHATAYHHGMAVVSDAGGAWTMSLCRVTPGSQVINIYKNPAGDAFTATTSDNTAVRGYIEFEIAI